MDNITHLVPAAKSVCAITLNPYQYEFYQQSCIEIHSPDGEHLESIGYEIQKDVADNKAYQLRDQIALLECLLLKINQDAELSPRAISGLADIFFRVQDFLREQY